ncbi:MAG: hypothetical protein ACF8GE_08120 [Phycisphaerales bacterium JB043]
MALITKNLGIAISDHDAKRISTEQLMSIFQDAIDNGDILEESNEMCVVAAVFPLIDNGHLRRSEHVSTFEQRMNAKMLDYVREQRNKRKPWWKIW